MEKWEKKGERDEGRHVDLKRNLNDSWKSMRWIRHWWVVNGEQCVFKRVCVRVGVRVCVHLYICTCLCMGVHATEGSGAAVYSTSWQGGCQNGPVSCVSSKIGPNTAEMRRTLWLFTAPTQCVHRMLPSVWNQTHCAVLFLLTDCRKDAFTLTDVRY